MLFFKVAYMLNSAWCTEKAKQTPIENMTIGLQDQNLTRFYTRARTQKWETYSKSNFLGFRHVIERYLNTPPYNKELQLEGDPRFMRSNLMLDAQLVHLRRNGEENVTQEPANKKTKGVFTLSSTLSLFRNVSFHIVLFFGQRSREGQWALTTNATGHKFVTMAQHKA